MMGRVATLIGCTEGQTYTILIALVLSLSMAAMGLPPTLEARQGMAEMAAPEGDAAPQQTVTPEEPPAADDAEDAPVDLPEATRTDIEEATGPEGRADPTDGPGVSPEADDGRSVPGASGDEDGFALEQGESLEERLGAAQLFARVGEPGVPHGVAVGDDAVYVSTDNAPGRGQAAASVVLRYSHDGEQTGEIHLEGQDGLRLRGAPDVMVDGDGAVLTVDPAAGRILHLDFDEREQGTHLEVPDLAPCALPTSGEDCEPGAVRNPPRPVGLAVAGDGSLFVADPGQATIWRVDRDGEARPWHQDSAYRLHLPAQGGLAGLAFDRDGHLLVVVSSVLDDTPAEGVLSRVEVEDDGSAGSREELVRTEPASGPMDVAAGDSGRIYLTLAGEDELLVLAEDGSEEARIDADDVAEGAGMPLDGPAGLAFHDDAVLVANSAADGDDENWAVLRIAVEDAVADPAS